MPIDMTSVPPPRKSTTGTTKPRTTTPRKKTPDVEEVQRRYTGLQGVGQALQMGLAMARQYADAGTVGMHWDNVARETAVLAETNPWAAKITDSLIQVGPLMGLVSAILPMGLQFMANHRMVDAGALAGMGVIHPETLEARMKADMARQAAEAMRMQREAEAEMAEMTRLMESSATTQNENGTIYSDLGPEPRMN